MVVLDHTHCPIWYPSSDFISMEGKPRNKRTFKLSFNNYWSRKTKKDFLQKKVMDKWNAGWQFFTEKHKKIHKICRNNLCAFALRNYRVNYKINKPLSGLLVYWMIMPSAERLSSKFHCCARSFTCQPTIHFLDNLSALGIILWYTSCPKGFIH